MYSGALQSVSAIFFAQIGFRSSWNCEKQKKEEKKTILNKPKSVSSSKNNMHSTLHQQRVPSLTLRFIQNKCIDWKIGNECRAKNENFIQFRCYNCLACGHLPNLWNHFAKIETFTRRVFTSFRPLFLTLDFIILCKHTHTYTFWQLLSCPLCAGCAVPLENYSIRTIPFVYLFNSISHSPLMGSFSIFLNFIGHFSVITWSHPQIVMNAQRVSIIFFCFCRYSHVDTTSS